MQRTKKDSDDLLREIRDLLVKMNSRAEINEEFSDSDRLIKKAEDRSDEALKKIGSSFDRIHDKLFAFNSVMLAVFLGLSKFPLEDPIFKLWISILPAINLIYLIYLEKMQMEIYRHQSLEMKWLEKDRRKHGEMISSQNLKSLLAILLTVGLFVYLFVSIAVY